MYFVYSLLSENDSEAYYIGMTNDIERRLSEHNSGQCAHTSNKKPWILKSYVAFCEKEKASRFGLYLKTGSGRAFAKKYF